MTPTSGANSVVSASFRRWHRGDALFQLVQRDDRLARGDVLTNADDDLVETLGPLVTSAMLASRRRDRNVGSGHRPLSGVERA